MKAASLLIALLALGILTACGGSGSGGDDAPPAPSKAVLTVAPASIELFAQSGEVVTLTIANTSSSITATSISALLPSGWSDVAQDASACASLPPQAHCTLSFTPGDASHPQASVNISGHNAETASATIVVSPFNGAVIEPLTATTVSMEQGQTVTMQFLNNSATITATNISARLTGTALAGNLTQTASGCAAVLPGGVCTLQFSSGNTTVSPTSFSIKGDNTSTIGGSIAIVSPTTAQLGIAGSPLVLQATAGTPVAGLITITNLSSDIAATNISADFSGTALDGNVALDASNCAMLAPAQSCTLSFTPGSIPVGQTSFIIQGDNTAQIGASIVIDAPQATLSVSGSPLTLFANGTPRTLVVTNNSDDPALDIAASFTGTALDGNVVHDTSSCPVLLSHQSCLLTFTPGPNDVPSTTFAIAGSNTNTVVASMAVRLLAVGDSFAGGIVFVLPAGGTPGTIIAPGTSSLQWGGLGTSINTTDFYDGAANTQMIVAALGTNGGVPYAAGYCDGLSEIDAGVTYDDWYLPAQGELDALIVVQNANSLGYLTGELWSSNEFDSGAAFTLRVFPFTTITRTKSSMQNVLCVRAFTL